MEDEDRLLLSVIVPLAPGETEMAGLLPQLAGLFAGCEVVLVGSDATGCPPPREWPDSIGLRRLVWDARRAEQLNRGAREAQGRWLWFLHADSRLAGESLAALQGFVADGRPRLGWFKLRFRNDGPRLTRLNEWGANLRSGWLGLPFGDQGLVLPAASFAALGGFDETALYGEDHLLVWAAHGARLPVRMVDARLFTSARKYRQSGWAATTWLHVRLTAIQASRAWRAQRRNAVRQSAGRA